MNDLLLRASLTLLGDDGQPAAPLRLATGISILDEVLGGGLVRGKIVEVFGGPSSGKTALALKLTAGVQKRGGTVAFIDAEGTLDPAHAAAAGVDLKTLVAARPTVGEEALQIADALLRTKAVDLIVVDSVAALVPRAELLAPIGESPAGLHARLMSQSLRRLVPQVAEARAVLLFLNQQRTDFDEHGKGFLTTTGGAALHFYAATRISVRHARGEILVHVHKDRFGAEGRLVVLPLAVASSPSPHDPPPP